jgi:hypothetical protein
VFRIDYNSRQNYVHSLFPPTYPTFYYPNNNTSPLCITNLHVKKHTNSPNSTFCHPNVFLSVLFPNIRNARSDTISHKYARNFQTNWKEGLKNWNCIATSTVYITKSHSGIVMCDKNIFSLRHHTGGIPDVINNVKLSWWWLPRLSISGKWSGVFR